MQLELSDLLNEEKIFKRSGKGKVPDFPSIEEASESILERIWPTTYFRELKKCESISKFEMLGGYKAINFCIGIKFLVRDELEKACEFIMCAIKEHAEVHWCPDEGVGAFENWGKIKAYMHYGKPKVWAV